MLIKTVCDNNETYLEGIFHNGDDYVYISLSRCFYTVYRLRDNKVLTTCGGGEGATYGKGLEFLYTHHIWSLLDRIKIYPLSANGLFCFTITHKGEFIFEESAGMNFKITKNTTYFSQVLLLAVKTT